MWSRSHTDFEPFPLHVARSSVAGRAANQGRQEAFERCGHHRAEGDTHDHSDGKVNDVAFMMKFLNPVSMGTKAGATL